VNSFPRFLIALEGAIAVAINGIEYKMNVTGILSAPQVTEMHFTLNMPEDKVMVAFKSLDDSVNNGNYSSTVSRKFGSSVTVAGSYRLTKVDFLPTSIASNPPTEDFSADSKCSNTIYPMLFYSIFGSSLLFYSIRFEFNLFYIRLLRSTLFYVIVFYFILCWITQICVCCNF
jgi:hypothetical protein